MYELELLANFIYTLKLEDLPNNVINAARYCVLDTIGSSLGAANSSEIDSIAKEYSNWLSPGKNEYSAALWGKNTRGSLHHALMVNGSLAHELELDDVHTASKSHVGAVVIPTAWTISDAICADGKTFLEAVVAGYEAMGRIGQAMDVSSNRKRGWHTTGVIGTFGAAAVAAKLFGLTPQQTISALGMAGTQSSGLWAFLAEGATCKKLHCARAAINGVDAALLAKAGMTGPMHILDAKDGGLFLAISDSFDISKICKKLKEDYVLLNIDKKPYPCCRTTHHAIDAALQLYPIVSVEDIKSIVVETYDVGVLQCGFEKYPETSVESKFSIAFCVAAAFIYGKLTQSEFTQQIIENPNVQRIAKATKVVESPIFTQRYPERWGCKMVVVMADNSQIICQIDDMSGSIAMPLTEAQEINKFNGLTEAIFDCNKTKDLKNTILEIELSNKLPDLQ